MTGPDEATGLRLWDAIARWALPVLGALLLSLPLLTYPLPATHDGLHHLFRLQQLDASLRSLELFPRVLADMGFSYGYPVFHYYSPLSYYVAWVGTALGAGYLGGLRLAYVLSLVLSALACRLWLTELRLPAWAAALGSLAYCAAPYRVADIYVRGALAESFAFVFPPLILWLGTRLLHGDRRAAAPLALSVALAILTHNLSAFLFAPAMAVYLATVALTERSGIGRKLAALAAMGVLGVGLSAWFWLPAIGEVDQVLAGTVPGANAELAGQLQPLNEWISPFVEHRYFPDQGTAGQHPLGLVQAALMVTGTACYVTARRRLDPGLRHLALASAIITTGALFLLSPASAPLWKHLQPLQYFQFPWRLQGVLVLTGAVLTAGNALWLRPAWILAGAVAAALMLTSLLGLSDEPARMPGAKALLSEADIGYQGIVQYDFQTALWLREHGGEWLLEYLPRWALERREDFFLPTEPAAPADPLAITGYRVERQSPLGITARISLDAPVQLSWHRFYLPAWEVLVDGQRVPTAPAGPLGLLSAEIPAGEHPITVRFGRTPLVTIGLLIGGGSILALLTLAWRTERRMVAIAAVVLVAFATLVLARAQVHPTVQRPTSIDARLGQEVALVGADVRPEAGQIAVTLYWLALAPPQRDYRVFVHAVRPDGATVAQHDGQPGLEFSPTTRWEPGELILDRHFLPLPNGPVTLVAGMYTAPEVVNLPAMVDGVERPDGRIEIGQWQP